MQNFRLRVDQQHTNMSDVTVFSGGEVHVDISNYPVDCHDWCLKARLQSGNDIMHMFMLVDAMRRRWPNAEGTIKIPYLPYARQDRVCASGQHFGLQVFINQLRTLGKYKVVTYDVHSDVASDLLTDAGIHHKIIPQHEVINGYPLLRDALRDGSLQIVAPDRGALHKSRELHSITGNPWPVAVGEKTRDPSTGQITGFTCDVLDFEGRDLLIPDDICDGGGTFIGLASLLKERNCGRIMLYVTHGIFSKGFDCFSDVLDGIVTTDSFYRGGCVDTVDGEVVGSFVSDRVYLKILKL